MNIERGFRLAKNASEFSDCSIKIGAVLMYKNKVISVGYNTTKSNPIQKAYNVYRNANGREYDVERQNNGLHAEIMALQHAIKNGINIKKCKLFIYSETKYGMTRLTKPCYACNKYLENIGFQRKNIYYTMNGDFYGK